MSNNARLFELAKRIIPGGVNSPGRAFINVGSNPIFVVKGQGAYLTDTDNKTYLDYISSMGANIVGSGHPDVVKAITDAANRGIGFWLPTEQELELVQKIVDLIPSVEMLRMVNSGTEATMSAIRLARAFTKKNKIIKFNGCYHGHNDAMLVNSGSATLDIGVPSSPGVPQSSADNTLTAEYNDLDSVNKLIEHHKNNIAAIIVEPIAGNMSCVPPQDGFLEGLRELCDQNDVLLIFDEVMTGFRVSLNCAQSLYNVTPDLTTLGKVIGGGMPVGAFGGRKDIMAMIAPSGPVYHAGTLSGNPITVAAGLATMNLISQPGFFDRLNNYGQRLATGLSSIAQQHNVPMVINQVGGMFGLFFTEQTQVSSFDEVMNSSQQQFKQFFIGMLNEGILFAPSAFESSFLTSAHGEDELAATLQAANCVLAKMALSTTV